MMPFLQRYKRKIANKKGMTVVETIVTLAITTIILAFIVAGVMRIVIQAYMTRANETAEVVYMAVQSAITDLKTDGTFDETFAKSKQGDIGQFHTIPEKVIKGGTVGGVTYPGVKTSSPEEEDYLQQLIDDEDLVYMKLSQDDSAEDSELLKKLLEPYISDKSILEYSILVELNLNNKTVRAAYFTEQAEELLYEEGASLTKDQLLSKKNVLLRDRHPSLYKKRQGYYGALGAGEPENLGILENAYVRVNNDDMLTIEWGEIGPVENTGGVTEEKRELFTDMSYDLKIVNAHDTSKVYYQLEDITAYKKGDNYAEADKTVLNKPGLSSDVRDPMPIYDLYDYEDVNNALDEDLMVPVRTTVYNDDGSVKKVYDGSSDEFKHRLSYYVPADISGEKQYGVFRLVLDSITGDDPALSVQERYPEIPWDEDFKVIVEGKYKGEGFTGSLSVSDGQDNAYVASKSLNPEEDMYFNGKRGANVLQELWNYVVAKRDTDDRANMWYQVGYARHLNNMRYITEYEDDPALSTAEWKNGYKQNFLLTDDIDWSTQKLGAKENVAADGTIQKVHMLTVSNAEGDDLTVTNASSLRTFQAIGGSSGSNGYQGMVASAAERDEDGNIVYQTDEHGTEITHEIRYTSSKTGITTTYDEPVPVYHTYQLSHLKLANEANNGKNVGIFETVGQNGYLKDFMVSGAAAQGKSYVGTVAGEFEGYANNLTVLENTTPNYHQQAEYQPVSKEWVEKDVEDGAKKVEPYSYPNSSQFKGNTVKAKESYAGGVFGYVGTGTKATQPADGKSGTIRDISNGTRLVDLYAGKIDAATQNQNPALGNAAISDLNGLTVQAKNYAGGLIGQADKETQIIKVANTGSVTATEYYAGGIAGVLEEKSVVDGWDKDALKDEEHLTRDYQYIVNQEVKNKELKADYTNYGYISAKGGAGGITGQVNGVGTVAGDETKLNNLANAGRVEAENQAAGIAAVNSGKNVVLTNVRNKAEVVADSNEAGGIVAEASDNLVIQGAQNQATQTGKSLLDPNKSSRITAGSYAGGIVGYGDDQIDIRHYRVTKKLGGLNTGDIVRTSNTGEIYSSMNYAGGIAGAFTHGATLNVNNPASGTVLPVVNHGTVTAGQSYAGGVIGVAAGSAKVRNAENNSAVITANAYAGGIIGAMSSEADTGIGSATTAAADFANEIIIAKDGTQVKAPYYTNSGKVQTTGSDYAGGIVGYINTTTSVTNVFNSGEVTARNHSGGVFGAATFGSKLEYDTNLLKLRMTHSDKMTANRGAVSATGNNAGGIAGSVLSEHVVLYNAFNQGVVTAGGDNAGGIAGAITNRAFGDQTLTYSMSTVLLDIAVPASDSSDTFYTNTGSVQARNNAGGIVGNSATDLQNVFNSGNVTATGNNAGGVAGVIENGSQQLDISYSDSIADRLLNKSALASSKSIYANRGTVKAQTDNAGGVIGYGKRIIVENAYNAGAVSTISRDNAGGIAGNLIETSVIRLSAPIVSKTVSTKVAVNTASVTARRNSAGGIVGRAAGDMTITDVFNKGTITASGGNNAGGIAGVLEGQNTLQLNLSVANASITGSFPTNQGTVRAGGSNAGGIIGNSPDTTVIKNMFNHGSVSTGSENAGGIAGFISTQGVIELDTAVAQNSVSSSFQTNQGNVTAGTNNAGGIAGKSTDQVKITDVFNKGTVRTGIDNAGGTVGYLTGSVEIKHNDDLVNNYILPNHFMTNQGNVTATGNNAGGIVGKAMGDTSQMPILKDVYSGKAATDSLVVTANNNAGGMAGRAADVEITNEKSVDKAISLNLYTNNSKVTARQANAGGIIGNADNRTAADNKFAGYTLSTMNSITTGAGLSKNGFRVGDVYNCGTVSSATNNAGGIIGVGGDGYYYNTAERVEQLIAQGMYTNVGKVTASRTNAGGIIGFANEKFENTETTEDYNGDSVPVDVGDVFNAGEVTAESNAGGIAGKAINFDLKYTKHVLKEAMKAEDGDLNHFLFTNTNKVSATNSNAGGIIGDANNSILQDTFNSGTSLSHDAAVSDDGENKIIAGVYNAGGLVGRGRGLSITYSELIADQIRNNRSYVYTNIANVYAGNSRAGGILGYGTGSVQLADVYNMGKVEARSGDSAGGLVGELAESGSGTVTDQGSTVDLSGITLADNKVLTYNTDSVTGEPTIETDKRVSYITYQTITTSAASTTNRYSNCPKEKTITDGDADNIIAGRNNAGGIVGFINASSSNRSVRIENVFNSGAVENSGRPIAGIRARGNNAGGLVGYSKRGYISYSFDINPGPYNRDTTGKGDHSTFAEAFNDIEVREDPYAIEESPGTYVGLHMVANNALVRASAVDDGSLQTTSQIQVDFESGRQNMSNQNAGGAVGYMEYGRIERVYSLQGEVVSPKNVGGVVGNSSGALIKQVSRLDGEDISLGTELVNVGGIVTLDIVYARGSENVGGVVGLASNYSEILDTRNYIEVEGRTAVGGIVGKAGSNTKVTLAQNAEPITGIALYTEDVENMTGSILPVDAYQLDKSKVDGCYIGGIVGCGDNSIQVTMAKNDPLITEEFSELKLDNVYADKYTLGGNDETAINGKSYIGGITGAYGIVNYSVNTGTIDGIKIIGGVSGSGYRITNSFNTADVIGQNGYMYEHAVPTETEGITKDQQATHIGGIAGELGERIDPNAIVQDRIQSGTYIQSVYNGAQTVRGASYVGGVAGYAVGPIDVAYNSAVISAKQTGITSVDPGIAGTKVGGLVGVMAQDRNFEIKLSNSYSVGEIVGTNDRGTLVGLLEGYTAEVLNYERVDNSYYLSDDQIKSWNSLTAQLTTEINYGLKPLDVTDGYSLENYVAETGALTADGSSCNVGDTDYKTDTQYGLRTYSNMVRDYMLAGSSIHGSGNAAKGEDNLQTPLNDGIKSVSGGTTTISKVKAPSASITTQRRSSAKFVYPYTDVELTLGEDYEFPQLNFSGEESNDNGIDAIPLDDYTAELTGNNQFFTSLDNTKVSYYHNYWPTKMIDYLETSVEYNDGGNNDISQYTEGKLVSGDDKTDVEITFRENDKYPTQRVTNEEIIFHGSYTKASENPEYIHFEVYDGHSRGRYSPTNDTFTNIVLPKSAVKTYTLAKASLFGMHEIPTRFIPVTINSELYYFYTKDTNNANGSNEYEAIDNLAVTVDDSGATVELQVKLNCLEMNSYLPASSGYFTVEATKVYDAEANIPREDYSTGERTSRMFSMHFSNTEIDDNHNDSVLDLYPDFDYDDLDTLEYSSADTAALGGTLLAKIPGENDYEVKTANKLQIRNERHLYDMNHGETMGYADIGSSNLKYLMRDIELMNDIQLSTTPEGYNGFIIGASNEKLYRMTGSLDGNGYTIGNIRVNRFANPGNFTDLPMDHYAFIYDLSGGIVKNLYLGDDSKIIARTAGGLAYYVSNGRKPTTADPYADPENMMYENLSPQLPKEVGTDAKIYDTTVLAQITGTTVGGFSAHTGRRFNSSTDVPGGASGSETSKTAATYTDVTFGGKINAVYGSSDPFMQQGDYLVPTSSRAAGIQCYVSGNRLTDDIDETKPGLGLRSNYRTDVAINGSQVSEDGYVYANHVSAGILCEALYPNNSVAQVGVIQKSVNNGTVVAKEQANGITQGIVSLSSDSKQQEACANKSHVDVTYSYNNGIVQTPEGSGLASGIGNYVSEASYCTNNGSVYGRIASGISNYGDKHTKVDLSVNNGYVQGGQIAGGIVAAPSKFDGSKAVPNQEIQLKLSNSYNTGQVVVTTNIDNKKAIENSYAGGILGYASSPKPSSYSWDNLNINELEEDDDRKTIIKNCYNVGTVKYAKDYTENAISSGTFSDNNRNIGGIAGGGLNRFVDIQNCYSLSDAELLQQAAAKPKKTNINASPTDFTKHDAEIQVPSDTTGYNYRLTAVGDVTYGDSVTTMNYADMSAADNFVGFDDNIWAIDHATVDGNGDVLYPFPQFKARETDCAYVGDEYVADEPDFAYNVSFNLAKNDVDIETPSMRMDTTDVTYKALVNSDIQYNRTDSEYSIDIAGYTSGNKYQITVYDGDPYEQDYAAAIIRQYQIDGGTVTSGGKLHDEKSTTEQEMQFFDAGNVSFNSGKLTIKNAEEAGWYMPNHGFYSVVVTKSTATAESPGWLATIGAFLSGDGTVHGNLKTAVKGKTSDRFQVHFGGAESDGSNIHSRGLFGSNYKYGTAADPYHVTDQYSVIGMTTSGIAQNATDGRYYRQTEDFTIDKPFYSMFEFNGDYDGNGHTITQTNGDIGFISYLRSTDEDALNDPSKFTAAVHDLTLDITAVESDEKMSKLGKYQEASNYTANMGLIADYMESACIAGVSTDGVVQPKNFHPLATEKKYIDGCYTLAGIAAVAKESKIETTQNNADVGVKTTANSTTISIGTPTAPATMDVAYEDHSSVTIQVAGITALAKDTSFDRVSNDGMITASAGNRNAAGLVHTLDGSKSSIKRSINGGWVKAHNGVAAGIVKQMKAGEVSQVYNSGRITAGYITQVGGSGTAVGIAADLNGGTVSELYNAGVIMAKYPGAIARRYSDRGKFAGNAAYYLKDDALFWADSYSLPNLPDSMEVDAEEAKQLEILMGFGIVPTEVWAFADNQREDYVTTPADPLNGIDEVYDDPFTITYQELTDKDEMKLKGFDMTTGSTSGAWVIDASPANTTIDTGNPLVRDYGKDPYPLPKFAAYDHGTRENLNFPLFFGEAEQIAKTPYSDTDQKLKYEPYDFTADAGLTEIFKDTIKVDLNEMKSTAKYQVLVYDGDADAADLEDKNNTKLIITVNKKYLDLRNPLNVSDVSNPDNLQYSNIYSTSSGGAYYYEIAAIDSSGNQRPAILANKDFVNDQNEILFNNNVLDYLPEPSDSLKPYYSATVINYQIPGKDNTDLNHFYSKFSPHFADATETQGNAWTYGTAANPYEIATKRNLNHIALGGQPQPGGAVPTDSHYLSSHYSQTQNIELTDQKKVINSPLEGPQVTLWQNSIGTALIDFTGSYTAKSSGTPGADGRYPTWKLIEKRTSPRSLSIFDRISKEAVVSDVEITLPNTAMIYKMPFLVRESYGTINNITVSPQATTANVYVQTTNPYGFIVGETFETPGVTGVPRIEDITMRPGITIRSNGSGIPALAAVIGRVNGQASIQNMNVASNLYTTNANVKSVGGVIGEIIPLSGATVNADITMNNITASGTLSSNSVGYNQTLGGIVGDIRETDITLQNIQKSGVISIGRTTSNGYYGGLIGKISDGSIEVTDSKSSAWVNRSTTSANSGGVIGGIIGKVEQAPNVTLNRVEAGTSSATMIGNATGNLFVGGLIGDAITSDNSHIICVDETTALSNLDVSVTSGQGMVGGFIGRSSGYELDIRNSQALGNINATTSLTAARLYAGGILGQETGSTKVTMEAVSAGRFNDSSNAAETAITVGGQGEIFVGGIAGDLRGTFDMDDPDTITADDIHSNHNLSVTDGNGKNVVGGIIGHSQGVEISLSKSKALGSIGQTVNNNSAMTFTGGIIGQAEEAPGIILTEVTSGVFDEDNNQSLSNIHVVGNGSSRIIGGGIIGHASVLYNENDPAILKTDAVMNNSAITITNPATASAVGGIIGQQNGYEVTLSNTVNRGNIKTEQLGDESRLYAGGFIGKAVKGTVTLKNTSETSDSNVVNYGDVETEVRVQRPGATDFAAGTLYTAGGVAFSENCETTITGFRNAGNINVTGENQDMNLYMAGALGFATNEETIAETFSFPITAVTIQRTLNEGNLYDSRTELTEEEQALRTRVPGAVKAAGIAAETSLDTGTGIRFSQNNGVIKAATAAGMIHTVDGADNIARSSIMYNINTGFIDVKETSDNGDNITMTKELPVGEDAGGIIYNALGGIVFDPTDVYDDTVIPVLTTHYNLTMEDAIRPENWEPEEEPAPGEEDKSLATAEVLTLAEMQDYDTITARSGWSTDQIDRAAAVVNADSPWLIHSADEVPEGEALPYLLPTIRGNEATPREDRAYLAKAVYDVQMTAIPGGGYQVNWSYDDEIDPLQDGFAIIIDSEQGETRKILELDPGVATKENDSEYSYNISAGLIANVTNQLADDELHKVRVAAMRGESRRRLSSLAADITLEKTTGITEDNDTVLVVISPANGFSLMNYRLGYDGTIGNAVVAYAHSRLGDPYSMPLAGQGSYVDCSYLSLSAYKSVGISLPRTAAAQAQYMVENGYTISKDQLQPGDLIFYSWGHNGRFMNIGHVSIYIGNNQVIEASSTQGKVVISNMYADNCQVLYGRPYASGTSLLRTGVQSAGNGISVPAASPEEVYLIAQIVGLEAGGTGDEGMIAVAEVIKNRVLSGKFPNTYTGVVAAPGQFTTYAKASTYVPTQHQIDLVQGVMNGNIGVLNNPNVLYFCAGYYYNATGVNSSFWGGMTIVADYGNYFFIP